MRCKNLMLAVALGVVLPWFLLLSVEPVYYSQQQPTELPTVTQQSNRDDLEVAVLTADDCVEFMELDDYLLGVVLAEMPASFEMEALRAQAVVARTFTCKGMQTSRHGQAAVCTQASCCQAYISADEYIRNGGTEANVQRVKGAVDSTCNQVLYYEDELIVATYFSCSGGRTEDAVAVWGTQVPYLQATDSPGEEDASHYMDTEIFDVDRFEQLLGGTLDGGIGSVTYTAGGGVETIEIGGITYTGIQLRQKLGLRSTAFTISIAADKVSVTTKGYGHRVGMSQYGANAMAASGSGYEEILCYYYKGTNLGLIDEMIV